MPGHGHVRGIGILLGGLLALAACGSSGSSAVTPAPTAAQQVRQAWVTFFDGDTAAAQKIALLQDGTAAAPVIRAQAGSSMAASTAAVVSKVQVTSARRAIVRYTITLSGSPVLANQTGTAVKVGGHWVVGLGNFCGLLALEHTELRACSASTHPDS